MATANTQSITKVKKRDGRIVGFEQDKITNAIFKAAQSVGGHDHSESQRLSDQVVASLSSTFTGKTPTIEDVQDMVEKVLIEAGHAKTAKAYILYRNQRAAVREKTSAVPDHVRELVHESKKFFRNPLSEFVYFR